MTQAFDLDDRHAESSGSTWTRYRLDVIASSVDDLVRSAGGWLFDRSMAGWQVSLRLAEPLDARPLKILGINTVGPAANQPRPQAIAVSADVFNTDERVRANVVAALERGLTEVTLWGDPWPPEFHPGAQAVEHRLSAAARAFKSHAVSASVTGTERFRSGSRWIPPYEPDLTPIG